ncbi:MAG: MFS transporter [Chloroflexota bacterium]|nr:MFS transporter [Chloroflexota bacterium]
MNKPDPGAAVADAAAHVAPQAHSRRLKITLYVVVVFLYWIGLYLYAPTLPTYVEMKTENLAMVGVILSMYGLWQAIIRLPLGIVSDWVGQRKPFVVTGLGLVALGAWLMGISDGAKGLLIGRAITGLSAGTWVPLIVLFSSLFPPQESVRASSLLTLVGSVGRLLATGVTGWLNMWGGYSLAFFLAAGAAALAALVMISTREEPLERNRPSFRSVGGLFLRRDIMLPSLISTLCQYINWAATFSFIPLLAEKLGATDIILSALLSMNIGVFTVGNLVATTLANRLGARRLVFGGVTLLACGTAVGAFAPNLIVIFVAQFLLGLAQGATYPVLMGLSIRHVDDVQRSTAMGLHQSVYAIGMFAGPALSGIVADAIGIRPMLGATAGIFLAAGLFAANQLRSEEGRGYNN